MVLMALAMLAVGVLALIGARRLDLLTRDQRGDGRPTVPRSGKDPR